MGHLPDEADIVDWVLQTGDILYSLRRANGEFRYVYVELDMDMLESVRTSAVRGKKGIYLDRDGESSLLALYLTLVFLEQGIPPMTIRRELGMSEETMSWLLDIWQLAAGVMHRRDLWSLVRSLSFR